MLTMDPSRHSHWTWRNAIQTLINERAYVEVDVYVENETLRGRIFSYHHAEEGSGGVRAIGFRQEDGSIITVYHCAIKVLRC